MIIKPKYIIRIIIDYATFYLLCKSGYGFIATILLAIQVFYVRGDNK